MRRIRGATGAFSILISPAASPLVDRRAEVHHAPQSHPNASSSWRLTSSSWCTGSSRGTALVLQSLIPTRCCGGHRRSVVPFEGCSSLWSTISTQRRFAYLPHDQSAFSAYTEIDLPSESRIEIIQKCGLGASDWVATEKVHGANFGIYLLDEKTVRFSKRSGIMDPNENFFGYHVLVDEFTAQIRILCDLVKQKFNLPRIGRLIMNGELFGCMYKHPMVPKSTKWCTLPNGKRFPMSGVRIQNDPFPQYSPEIHFFAFDIKYSVSGEDSDFVMLGYDDFIDLCRRVPNLLHAKALVRGTLTQCLAFDVENFITPLPAILGLGNYPMEGNLAEGVVIRHARRGAPDVERHNVSTIIKLRCSSFMELKHPGKQKELKDTFVDTVRAAAIRKNGEVTAFAEAMMPALETAANALLLNNVSEGRLNNVLSKVGREPLLSGQLTSTDVALLLAKDALKDFLKEVEPSILNTSLQFRKLLISNVYHESVKLLMTGGKWAEILEREKQQGAAEEEGGGADATLSSSSGQGNFNRKTRGR